jgi:hypothetical protein
LVPGKVGRCTALVAVPNEVTSDGYYDDYSDDQRHVQANEPFLCFFHTKRKIS